ncbi:MAG TPA: nuclear transport factor 2 family protein [Ktedonobacterales bacterium]
MAITDSDPRAVVQEQVDAYNAHDLERFLACYALNAVILDASDTAIYNGHDEIRDGYGPMLEENPALHAEIPNRIHVGEWVVDEELVTGITAGGFPPDMRAITVYHVADGKIQRVQILM